uniref:Cell wall protein-like n=2 Tax=Oryza sativa subsp. japonica TaxID=39947 RepID=Q6ZHX8_ORYSJ|nr:cell wall protein-like [Oryza sativa Japonica Group]BAC92558.1 cell wall protein-like [Oryza sativa Japonica Group]
MVPPIAGNGRAKSGRLPLPPATIPVAVPAPPVAGSLPHPIKWDPHPPFSRFSPIPSLPVVTPGAAFPPSPSSFLRAGHLQPHLPPHPCTLRLRRLLPRPRSHLLSLGQPSVSRGKHRRRVLAGVQWRRHHFSVSGRLLFVAGAPTDVAVSSVDVAVPSSLPARPRRRPNFAGTPSSPRRPLLPPRRLVAPLHHHLHQRRSGVFHAVPSSAQPLLPAIIVSSSSPIVLVVDVPSVARLVVSRRRLRRRHRSGVVLVVLVPVQPLPAVLVASSPVPVVVVVVVLSSFPVVVAPVLASVLGSASSSLVPAASRLCPRIAAEAVPSPFVSVVPVCLRRARSSLAFPRLVAWW